MKKQDARKNIFYPLDIGTCLFCSYYNPIDMRIGGEDYACGNIKSPYYKPPKKGRIFRGTYLEWWEELEGCKHFNFNGEKMPSHMLKSVPSDSRLRNVPIERIVLDWQNQTDISPYINMEELVSAMNEVARYEQEAYEEGWQTKFPTTIHFIDGVLTTITLKTNEIVHEFFKDKIKK